MVIGKNFISSFMKVLFLLVSLFFGGGSIAQTEVGIVKNVVGTAYIIRDFSRLSEDVKTLLYELEENEFGITIIEGQKIFADDTILTDRQSNVTIELNDKSYLSIGELTKFSFEDFNYTTQRSVLITLIRGILSALVKIPLNTYDKFEIKTPTSITGVRGTQFIISTDEQNTETSVLKGKVEVASIDPNITKRVTVNEGESVTTKKNESPGDVIQMSITKQIGLLSQAEKVRFKSGGIELMESSYVVLDTIAYLLKKYRTARIRIEAHTDNTGSPRTNLTLSYKRANVVKDFFVKKGIEADRIETKGFGDTMPIADNSTPEGRSINRRIEFVILQE